MIIKNSSEREMKIALVNLNKRFSKNIAFKRFDPIGKRIRFTLKAINCKGPGGKLSAYPIMTRRSDFFDKKLNDRHVGSAACWHAHGYFFEEIFKINPDAIILSRGKAITANCGNWEDDNIGSRIAPVMFSEACDCNPDKKGLTSDCWPIQFTGLLACKKCEFKNTANCGGKNIIEKIKNGVYPKTGIAVKV